MLKLYVLVIKEASDLFNNVNVIFICGLPI